MYSNARTKVDTNKENKIGAIRRVNSVRNSMTDIQLVNFS